MGNNLENIRKYFLFFLYNIAIMRADQICSIRKRPFRPDRKHAEGRKMKVFLKRHKFYLLLLTAVFFALIYLFIPENSVFGSNTDWMSQHAVLAETLRDACIEQKTILPDFLWLGGGSNSYQFSYYGYLRPDILLGCLLPQIPMIYLLIGCMMLCVLASGLLCYIFLIQNGQERLTAFIGSVLLMTAGCFFQAHRQVMFVNYMPYEILALLLLPKLIERKRYTLFTLMLTLVMLNSFYYSITVLAVMTWRMYELCDERRKWFLYLRSVAVSIGLAGVLLLPTAMVLLEHRRQGTSTSLAELFRPDFSMEGLLYQPYGMGLTLIALYALLAGLTVRTLRKRSIVLLAAVLFPAVSYFLNGMLYARAKILMPLLPLVILQIAELLQLMLDRKFRIRIWPELLFGAAVYAGIHSFFPEYEAGVLLDVVLLVMILCMIRFYNRRRMYVMLLTAPFVCSVYTARQDNYVTEGEWISPFTEEEIREVVTDPWARMDGMESPLISSNRLLYPEQKTSTMYSSVTNQEYSKWYYDIMNMPIRINNRVAMLCEVNPFEEYLMGVKYLQTTVDKIPVGYEIIARKGDSVIVENDEVLPLAWFSTDTMSEEEFSRLEFPYNVEALLRYTVADRKTEENASAAEQTKSAVKEVTPLFSEAEASDGLEIRREEETVSVHAEKTGTLTLTLDEPVRDQIVILAFDVKGSNGKRVTIDVNGVRNRLSSAHASYPNENSRFVYYLTVPEGESLETLKIRFSAGDYELTDFGWYEYPVEELVKEDAVGAEFTEPENGSILSGTVEAAQDGYFVTSIPYQKGLQMKIDGQEVPVEKVNTAFAGAKMEQGSHTFEISFVPPGKKAGLAMSAIALYLLIFCPVWDRVRRKREAGIR